jgi:hypothetical protein
MPPKRLRRQTLTGEGAIRSVRHSSTRHAASSRAVFGFSVRLGRGALPLDAHACHLRGHNVRRCTQVARNSLSIMRIQDRSGRGVMLHRELAIQMFVLWGAVSRRRPVFARVHLVEHLELCVSPTGC